MPHVVRAPTTLVRPADRTRTSSAARYRMALVSAVHHYVPGDLPLLLVQIQHGALQHAVGVGAARVHREGLAELLDPLALVDVPVHRQGWLVLEDGLSHRGRAHRLHHRAAVYRAHVLV